MTVVIAKDVEWDTYEGESQAFSPGVDPYWEISISAAVKEDLKWGVRGSNVRTWTVVAGRGSDPKVETIAEGEADGLRAAKKDSLNALNQWLSAV